MTLKMRKKEGHEMKLLPLMTIAAVMLSCLVVSASAVVASTGATQGIVILPKTLKPIHYDVWLQPFINGNFSIEGKVDIEVEALNPTHHIILHMRDIVTKNESSKVIDKDSGQEIVIVQQRYEPNRHLYIAQLQEQLQPGRNYILSLEFTGTLGELPRGFYRSSYTKEDGNKSWVASTQFQSTDARRAFPCFDEPGLKATFTIHLARENHMTALTNMPLVRTTPIENQPDWVWDEFQKSVPMSTYLIAFAVSDFSSRVVSSPDSDTIVRVWTRAAVQDRIDYAARFNMRSLEFFENYFSIKYPLPKMDMICPPTMSSNAMENWGLITYRESGFIYDPETASAEKKKWISYLISHELAHQWFGNLVTLEWWTDLWLNEGFATYMGDTAVDHVEPSWGILDQFVVHRLQAVFAMDSLRSSHPVSVPVNDPVEINEIFDSISYLKGASIIRMMSSFLTENTFKRALLNYLTTLKYKNADQDDLWRFLTEVAHEDGTLSPELTVKTIMDTWTLKKGFPVVTVTRAGNNSAILTQEQFYLDKDYTEEEPHRWWVPVTYTSQANPDFDNTKVQFWLNDRGIYPVSQIGFPPSDQWVIFNVKQMGYYRVNYDVENWNLLAKQLQTNHEVIHVTNRAQIIDDALNLARAGRLSYTIALDITSYLSKEKSYVAWVAAFNNFQYMFDMLRHNQAFGAFRDYLLSIIQPIYDHVGFEERPDDDLQTQLLRGEVLRWACKLRHDDCIHRSMTLFREWMNTPKNFKGISSNVAAAVHCTAIREGEEREWEFAWKKDLQTALACSEHMWISARYLRAAFNESSGIRRQEVPTIFRQVSKSSVGSVLAWQYMMNNWDQISEYIGTTFFALPAMVDSVSKTFNTNQKFKELTKFKSENADNLLTARRAVDQALEATKLNVAWMEDNYEDVVSWFRERGFSSDLSPP